MVMYSCIFTYECVFNYVLGQRWPNKQVKSFMNYTKYRRGKKSLFQMTYT